MPAFLATENENQAPTGAMWTTSVLIQSFLLLTVFAEYAFTLALKMTSSMTLVPYLLVAAFGVKLAWTNETYGSDRQARNMDLIRSSIAAVYAAGMIYAGGAKFLLLSALIYAPGTALYFIAMREQGQNTFTAAERIVFALVLVAAIIAVVGLASGAISI